MTAAEIHGKGHKPLDIIPTPTPTHIQAWQYGKDNSLLTHSLTHLITHATQSLTPLTELHSLNCTHSLNHTHSPTHSLTEWQNDNKVGDAFIWAGAFIRHYMVFNDPWYYPGKSDTKWKYKVHPFQVATFSLIVCDFLQLIKYFSSQWCQWGLKIFWKCTWTRISLTTFHEHARVFMPHLPIWASFLVSNAC